MFPKGAELIIILVVVLLIFGPKNLPKLGSALGRTVKNLREGMNNAPDLTIDEEEAKEDEAEEEVEVEEEPAEERKVVKRRKKAAADKDKDKE